METTTATFPQSTTFPDGAVWTWESPLTISCGADRWSWKLQADATAAWLAVCTR